ncbi:hypothetical protein C0J52_17491 [Blattella germanica]|nr:hypothetical protein C0J52_26343 [Blattella germanica]PSN39115.1 hypothetical protein C0J52_17491 [Blattella germanica]
MWKLMKRKSSLFIHKQTQYKMKIHQNRKKNPCPLQRYSAGKYGGIKMTSIQITILAKVLQLSSN